MNANDAKKRIALLGMHLESNAFAPVCEEASFRLLCYLTGEDILADLSKDNPIQPAEISGFVDEMDRTAIPWEPVPILVTCSEPSGPCEQGFFDATMGEMRRRLTDAGPLALSKSFDSPVRVIEDAVLNFAQRARERSIDLSITKTDTVPIIEFDETRLRQIVTNLIENALIHTPKDGRVTVDISGSSNGMVMSVSDTGAGISIDDLPRIFDQFYRADPSRNRVTGGAGLGLTIVKRLVEAHGGTVSVASSPGDGTTFTVALPGREGFPRQKSACL